VTPRRARFYRALIWLIGALIVVVIATATVSLLWQAAGRLRDVTGVDLYDELTVLLLAVLACAALVIGMVRWTVRLPRPRLPPLTAEQIEALRSNPKDHFDALIAERTTRLQRWSTWGVVFGLLFTAGSLVYTARSLETSQEGQITDRYTQAIGQLGSKNIDVRLGAIYALQRLANDSERDRPTIVDVLSAYVRQHDPEPKAKLPERPDTDVQAALTRLGALHKEVEIGQDYEVAACGCDLRHTRVPGADLSDLRLIRADLSSADLHDAHLEGADLRGANLRDADLTGADLHGADLREADLGEAALTGVGLFETDLTGARLNGASLIKANLFDSDLSQAKLNGADLSGADLSDAGLTAADLRDANLREANVTGADLRQADLTGADLTGVVGLDTAEKDASTKLPS
jgi:uncharacterized protein YjbI with pentapeptide repeats